MYLYIFEKIVSLYIKIIFFFKKNRKIETNLISFFNTHDKGGGAAKICFQIFKSHPNSVLFVKQKRTTEQEVFDFDSELWNRIGYYARKIEKKYGLIDFSKIGAIALIKNKRFIRSKIIHIHNNHGYYLSFLIIKYLFKNKKVIWTLHDDYILTGHCSFAMSCNKWVNGCNNCPDLSIYPKLDRDTTHINQLYKLNTLKKVQPYIITPSQWLADRVAEKYPFLKNIDVIYNGVDIDIFKPTSEILDLKIQNNIPINKKVILFIAELSVNNPFKGGDILMKIVHSFENKTEYIFLTIGGDSSEKYSNVVSLQYINEDIKLAELYNIADVMLYPTKADNLPLVVLEAMACGTPVIASSIAGIPEIIEDGKDGYLVDNHDFKSYERVINSFFNLEKQDKLEISNKARNKIVEKFNIKKMINQYDSLYKSMIS